jgi:predicted nucleic acid-binding protein
MDTLDIHLRVRGELKAQIERAVAAGDYESPEACAAELLEGAAADLDDRREWYIEALTKGLESGPAMPFDENVWGGIRERLRQRREAREGAGR